MSSRWRVFAIAVPLALAVTIAASLLLPKKYTATASILIEPPGGNDPRTATAVSPVYLESLKTYEHLAGSSSLFAGALDHLNLRGAYAGVPAEVLKAQVLEVSKPRDTKILQVSVTLRDRQNAQKLARYIAEQTVAMNRALEVDSVRELMEDGSTVVQAVRSRLENAKKARDLQMVNEPVAGLEAEFAQAADLKARVDRELLEERIELSAYEARYKSQTQGVSQSGEATQLREGVAAAKAQVATLEQQEQELKRTINEQSTVLEKRRHEREILDKELQTAQGQYEAVNTRNNDILSSVSLRGERLEIIDSGVTPEKPSSPNPSLNAVVAFLASSSGCLLFLAMRFAYSRRRFSPGRITPR